MRLSRQLFLLNKLLGEEIAVVIPAVTQLTGLIIAVGLSWGEDTAVVMAEVAHNTPKVLLGFSCDNQAGYTHRDKGQDSTNSHTSVHK